jgi:hypothetical protein
LRLAGHGEGSAADAVNIEAESEPLEPAIVPDAIRHTCNIWKKSRIVHFGRPSRQLDRATSVLYITDRQVINSQRAAGAPLSRP